MAENKKRKGSRKYKPSGVRNSSGPSYKGRTDHSNSKFHRTNPKGFGSVNVIQKRGRLGK